MRKGRLFRGLIYMLLAAMVLSALFPIALTLFYSLEAPSLVVSEQGTGEGQDGQSFRVFPVAARLDQYYRLLIEQIDFMRYYLNSVIYTAIITACQLIIGATAAYALSCFRLPFRNLIFFLFLSMMVLPYQVVMVPNYLLINRLGLLNTPQAVIIPAIFGPFSVLLIRQYMLSLPPSVLEAAEIDGANIVSIFFSVVIPLTKPALVAAGMLSFAESWNMIEQPLILLSDERLYPLSLALLNYNESSERFAAAVLFMLPVLLIFLYFQEDIVTGIQIGDLK